MTDPFTLVVFASWEDRFREGFIRFLPDNVPSRVLMFYYNEYAEKTAPNRAKAKELCQSLNVPIAEKELRVEAVPQNWKVLRETLTSIPRQSHAVVDVSTMPREIIWITFWFLDLAEVTTDYVYHRPKKYGEWQSRDPQRPRLVCKMSGLPKLGARTAIVVVAGYDAERTGQLISFYEPSITLLGLQKRNEMSPNTERQRAQRFGRRSAVTTFETDAYSTDHGQDVLEKQMKPFLESHNIIMSSLGPKLSAVAMYRIHRNQRDIALTYTPSRQFNPLYSSVDR